FLNLGSNAVPVYFGGITDTTTFPWATIQSSNGHQTGGNVVLGPRSNSFVGNSYRDTKTVGDPVRGWAVGADMVSVIERASGASLVLCTDPSSSNSLVFADTDSATQARISYNHATDVMSLTASGQVVNMGAGYMRPGTNAQKSMGDASFR